MSAPMCDEADMALSNYFFQASMIPLKSAAFKEDDVLPSVSAQVEY